MKALSVKQPWASMIATGAKTIETRVWQTDYRGDLLIVSTKKPELPGFPSGQALCFAKLVNCRPMIASDEAAARCKLYEGAYSWVLAEIRQIKPFAVAGII